jgi:IMP dehydrogenase/GMP reductase
VNREIGRDNIGGDSVGDNKISIEIGSLGNQVTELRAEMIAAFGVVERSIAQMREENRAAIRYIREEHAALIRDLDKQQLEAIAQSRTMMQESINSLGIWYADLRDETRAVAARLDSVIQHLYKDRD